jgi:hypothetical protein
MKFSMDTTQSENILNSLINTNITDSRTCEVGATLVTMVLDIMYSNKFYTNMKFLLRGFILFI